MLQVKWLFQSEVMLSDMLLQVKGLNQTSCSVIFARCLLHHQETWHPAESKLVMTCQLFPNENRCLYKNVSSSQTVSLLNLQKIWGILGFWTKLPFPGPNGSIWPLEECISLFDALKVYLQPKMTLCIFSLHRKWYRTGIQARAPSSSVSSLRPTACNCVVSGHSGSHRG